MVPQNVLGRFGYLDVADMLGRAIFEADVEQDNESRQQPQHDISSQGEERPEDNRGSFLTERCRLNRSELIGPWPSCILRVLWRLLARVALVALLSDIWSFCRCCRRQPCLAH